MRKNAFTSTLCAFTIGASLLCGNVLLSNASSKDALRNSISSAALYSTLQDSHYITSLSSAELSARSLLCLEQNLALKKFILQSEFDDLQTMSEIFVEDVREGSLDIADMSYRMVKTNLKYILANIQQELRALQIDTAPRTKSLDFNDLPYSHSREELLERWVLDYQSAIYQRFAEKLSTSHENAAKLSEIDIHSEDSAKLWKDSIQEQIESLELYMNRIMVMTKQDFREAELKSFAGAYGPHTTFFSVEEMKEYAAMLSGSFSGVGATLLENSSGEITIESFIPGGSLEEYIKTSDTIHINDIIIGVAEKDEEFTDIRGMSINSAVKLIRGKKGSIVRLQVLQPDGVISEANVRRTKVDIKETFAKSAILQSDDVRVGYIKIPQFYRDFDSGRTGRNVFDDTRNELDKILRNSPDGIVLDLRNNGGGSLRDAVDLGGLFIKKGPIVQVQYRGSSKERRLTRSLEDRNAKMNYDGPLIVLTNRHSASASELVAAALQDYGRAIIIGEQYTHGKGTVQEFHDLNHSAKGLLALYLDGFGAVKFTSQKFYRLNGQSTHLLGVTPDVILPTVYASTQDREDTLALSMDYDSIPPEHYASYASSFPGYTQAIQQSRERIKQNQVFTRLEESSEKLSEISNAKVVEVSLDAAWSRKKTAQIQKDVIAEVYDPEVLKPFLTSMEVLDPNKLQCLEKHCLEMLSGVTATVVDTNEIAIKDPYLTESLRVIKDLTRIQ